MSDTIKINAVVFDIGGYGIEYDCVDKLIRIGKGKILKNIINGLKEAGVNLDL